MEDAGAGKPVDDEGGPEAAGAEAAAREAAHAAGREAGVGEHHGPGEAERSQSNEPTQHLRSPSTEEPPHSKKGLGAKPNAAFGVCRQIDALR
jgi:hypothetical protein